MTSEWDYIKLATKLFFSKSPEVLVGTGEDDCAVVKLAKYNIVMTADSLHESTDFPPQMKEWEKGYMSIAVNLSDIAAMGANPKYFLYTVTLKENYPLDKFKEFCYGIKKLADMYNVLIIGGDTDRGNEMSISGFALGYGNRLLLRKNAKPGEKVFLTGELGKAQLTLEQVMNGVSREDSAYPEKLYTPTPRVEEGLKLSKFASACTDISDSLAISLHNISSASGVKIELKIPDLSYLEEFVSSEKALELFLYSGGDYELVYTCKDDELNGIEIGMVIEGSGVFLNNRAVPFKGYTH